MRCWQRQRDIQDTPRHKLRINRVLPPAKRCTFRCPGPNVGAALWPQETFCQRSTFISQTRETRETRDVPQVNPSESSCDFSQGGPCTSACVASVRGHSAVWGPSIVPRRSKMFPVLFQSIATQSPSLN